MTAEEAVADALPIFTVEETPEGKSVTFRAYDPESLREVHEMILATPGMEEVAAAVELISINVEAMEEGGAEPIVSWENAKDEITSTLPALFQAQGIEKERIEFILD